MWVRNPGALDESLPQPGDPREDPLSHSMDYGKEEEWCFPSGGHLPQDRQACLGSPLLEAPRRSPSYGNQI